MLLPFIRKGRASLIVYYGFGRFGRIAAPRPSKRTLTTLDWFGLVTWEGKEPMLRMLQVDERRRAMGYRFEHGARRDKIKMIGNDACPPVMEAVIESLVSG